MFNITESPYWIVVDYCKRNIHVCWIFGPSLLSHGNGWFCFVGKKTFLLMRKNTSEVKMNWNLAHVTNTEVRSSGLSLLMMQIYSTNIHFLQMVITLWVQLVTVTMLVSNTSVHEGFFLLLQVKLESIGAEDIVDGNERLILAVIWMIILRFQIADISYEVLFINSSSILWKNQR